MTPAEDVTYDYDDASQLTGADRTGSGSDEGYTYDDTGNRTNTGYVTGANNQLLEDGTFVYTYDGEGNRVSRTRISSASADDYVTEYAWDHRNRLTEVTFKNNGGTVTKAVEYTYDMYNRRIGKVIDPDGATGNATVVTERYAYDGQNILYQFSGSTRNDLERRYFHGPAVDQILAEEVVTSLSSGGTVHWSLTDHQNTVRDLVNFAGDVLNHLTYDSFGRVTGETNAAVDFLFGYTGLEWDQETGQNHSETRYYDSNVGRWTQEDFIRDDNSNVNRYVGNSPTNFVDPSGLSPAPDDGTGSPNVSELVSANQLRPWRYWFVISVVGPAETGHAWPCILDTKNKEVISRGLMPETGVNRRQPEDVATYPDHSTRRFDRARAYPITEKDYNSIKGDFDAVRKAEEKRLKEKEAGAKPSGAKQPPKYHLFKNNCATFTERMAKRAIDSKAIPKPSKQTDALDGSYAKPELLIDGPPKGMSRDFPNSDDWRWGPEVIK